MKMILPEEYNIYFSFGMCKEGIINDRKTSTFCGTPGKSNLNIYWLLSLFYLDYIAPEVNIQISISLLI